MTTPYQPPADIWEVNARLQLDEPLEGEDDPRWVDTGTARGENSLLRLGQALGVTRERQLKSPPERGYYLFCGHRGSGKSTELRRVRNELDAPDVYYVVFADAAQELDVNNLRYQDILLHLAGKLMKRLENDGVIIEQVHGLFIYCAPVHLAYKGSAIRQNFNWIFQLPMIKLVNQDCTTNQVGREVMREMLHRRAAPDLFDDGVADILVEYSGGHPRDLLRLLHAAFLYTEHGRFAKASVERAVREAATDFRRFLGREDYELLAKIDFAQSEQALPNDSKRTRDLLYNLALLEYNNFYWRSHPVIRTIDAYEAARRVIERDLDG